MTKDGANVSAGQTVELPVQFSAKCKTMSPTI